MRQERDCHKKNVAKWVQQSNTRTSDNREQFRPVRRSISGPVGNATAEAQSDSQSAIKAAAGFSGF